MAGEILRKKGQKRADCTRCGGHPASGVRLALSWAPATHLCIAARRGAPFGRVAPGAAVALSHERICADVCTAMSALPPKSPATVAPFSDALGYRVLGFDKSDFEDVEW